MRHLTTASHPDLLVGAATGDDAAVWRIDENRSLIATVDFFTPIVDDAATWGDIAAVNSASDVYAMGGRPLFALNIVAWPRDTLPLELLAEALGGAQQAATRGGWLVVGGHTVDGPEPFIGQAVIGEVATDQLLTNSGAHPGEVIVLTKALGTGIVATAVKRLAADELQSTWFKPSYDEAVASMQRLNDDAAAAARTANASAATDITGFGLLGHMQRLALESGCALEIACDALPLLVGVEGLIGRGFIPGGTGRNLDHVRSSLSYAGDFDQARWLNLLGDPQTSGGLAFTTTRALGEAAVRNLRAQGHPAAIIGVVRHGRSGELVLRNALS